jgi:hypothetical protein
MFSNWIKGTGWRDRTATDQLGFDPGWLVDRPLGRLSSSFPRGVALAVLALPGLLLLSKKHDKFFTTFMRISPSIGHIMVK